MMLYGSKPAKPVPPPKINGPTRIPGFNGPQAYTYNVLAKQPGSDYKIRLRNIERARMETLRKKNEDDFKSLQRHNLLEEMIDVADKKYLYNRIKEMVECEMKANEHLYVEEECPKSELKVEEEVPERPRVSEQDLIEKANELKRQREEEDRKIVEEKQLQLFITNSEELRFAAIAKRKKDISNINYKCIQENERIMKEQRVQKREQAILDNLEILKSQNHEKEVQKQKLLEKKRQFRKELYEQVQQKEEIRKQERELKKIEREEFKKLNEKLNKEEELDKLQRIKKKMQRKEEIKQFTEERAKLFSKMNKATSTFDETFALSMGQNLNDNTAEVLEAKIQLKREIEMFMKHHIMIKEERRKQNEGISNILMKQINEIEEFKRSIDRETNEARRKRMEEGNKTLKEQLRSHKILLEQQKELKRKAYEESMKEHEEYLKEEKLLCEKKKQFKWQFRQDLNDQIKARNDKIENQRKIDMENHQKCMLEISEQEKLLKKLLNEL